MSYVCPQCGKPLAVYGPHGEQTFICNPCGWRLGGPPNSSVTVPGSQFSSAAKVQIEAPQALESPTLEAKESKFTVLPPPRQRRVDQIFRGEGSDAITKRAIAMRYISKNPSQSEIVEWLHARRRPLPTSWNRYHFDDWVDAWKTRPELVARLLSGITGKLRKEGYQVGRPYKM